MRSAALRCHLTSGSLSRRPRSRILKSLLLVFERAPVGFQTGDLRCEKDLVKRDKGL